MNGTIGVVEAAVPAVTPRRAADWIVMAKPRITLMVVMTAAVGYAVAAGGIADAATFLHLLAGTAFSAAGAGVLNMLMEREADGKMQRTRNRPLPAGRVAPGEALAVGTLLSAGGVAWLALGCDLLTAGISAFTILSYLFAYTTTKPHTSLCTVIGAVPGALPPVMGWTAARGSIDGGAVALFLVLFFWQLPHFLALAWIHREDYARAGYPMLPVTDPDGASTGRQVILQTAALVVASVVPFGMGIGGLPYLAAALLLGAGFLAAAIPFGLRRTTEGARRVFVASIVYLPLLMGAMMLPRIY